MKNAFENTIIDYLPYIDHLAYINDIYENGMVDIVNQQADLVAEQVRYSILKVTVHSRCFYIELNKKHTDSVNSKHQLDTSLYLFLQKARMRLVMLV